MQTILKSTAILLYNLKPKLLKSKSKTVTNSLKRHILLNDMNTIIATNSY